MASPATTLLIAHLAPGDDGAGMVAGLSTDGLEPAAESGGSHIVGMLTLVIFDIPTGTRAWVEDVVVDGAARGQGVGAALVGTALEVAAARGAQTVDLTSRPSREDANRLYVRLGFEHRTTNLYRLRLGR